MGGILDKKEAKKESIEKLSKMLSKEENLAKFISIIRSPLTAFSGLLSSGTTSFARALKAYAEGKGEDVEEKTEEVKEEKPVEVKAEEPKEEKKEDAPVEEKPTKEEVKEDAPVEEKKEEPSTGSGQEKKEEVK